MMYAAKQIYITEDDALRLENLVSSIGRERAGSLDVELSRTAVLPQREMHQFDATKRVS